MTVFKDQLLEQALNWTLGVRQVLIDLAAVKQTKKKYKAGNGSKNSSPRREESLITTISLSAGDVDTRRKLGKTISLWLICIRAQAAVAVLCSEPSTTGGSRKGESELPNRVIEQVISIGTKWILMG